MNCWHCKSELIWSSDQAMDGEDYPMKSDEYSMISTLLCPKCYSVVEVYKP